MERRKGFAALIALALGLSTVLAACGTKSTAPGASDATKPPEVKVVRFLHNETDPPSIKFFQDAIKEFEAANSGIKIEMEAVGTDARLQKITAALNTKTAPELFKLLPEERFDFVRKGYLEPLDDVVNKIGESDFVPGTIVKIDNKAYDLPYTIGNWGVMWYRDDLLKAKNVKPPTNWDELKASAKALTEDTNGDGKPDTFGIVFPAGKNRMTSIWFTQLLWSAGGTYFDKNFQVTFDNPATVQALQMLKDLMPYAPPGVGSYSYGDLVDVYLAKKVAINIYAARLPSRVAQNAVGLLPVTKTAPRPAGAAGAVKLVASNSFAIASSKVGAKNIAEAKKFLDFVITGKQSRNFSLTAFPHLVPPLKSVQQDKGLLEGDPLFKDRADLVKASFDTANSMDFDTEAGATFSGGKVTKTGELNPYMGAIIARHIPAMVVQKVVLENVSPAEAAKWGAEEMNKVLADLKK